MAMDLNAKAAYIRGLMTGMEFDADSKNGKVIAAMMDLLEEMAATVTEHDDALDQVYDELETLDQDLDDVVSDIYGDDEEDDDEDEDPAEETEASPEEVLQYAWETVCYVIWGKASAKGGQKVVEAAPEELRERYQEIFE